MPRLPSIAGFATAAVLALLLCPPLAGAGEPPQPSRPASPAGPIPQGPVESAPAERGHAIDKVDNTVHAPANPKASVIPRGASAKCRDNTYSLSQHRNGMCAGHGGVAQWINQQIW